MFLKYECLTKYVAILLLECLHVYILLLCLNYITCFPIHISVKTNFNWSNVMLYMYIYMAFIYLNSNILIFNALPTN